MPPKKIERQSPVSDTGMPEQSSTLFSTPGTETVKKPRKPRSPKSDVATAGIETSTPISSTPGTETLVKKPRKPRSPKLTIGSEVISSNLSDTGTEEKLSSKSSDVGSSNIDSKKASASSSVGEPVGDDFEGPDTSILTPFNKGNDEFQSRLASLTRSDAHHDLGAVFKDTTYNKDLDIQKAYNAGIPKPATEAYHEGEAFASVVMSADFQGTTIQVQDDPKAEDKLLEALNAVPDCTAGYNGSYSVFNIGVPSMPIFKYKVVKFITQCSNNSGFKITKPDGTPGTLEDIACKTNFGKTFVENTKLGEDEQEAAIIVDFSQHHFIEDLTLGEESQFKVHYLMTPEVVNDPAGKPNVNNKSLFGNKNTGVKLISYVETSDAITSYTKFDYTDPNTANNFFSNYDFTLSPIKQIITKQKAEKLITTLNIKYDTPTGKPLTDTIEDSKGENSITTVTGYLKKLMEQIKIKVDNAVTFNFNSKIQQKRGGDWFQALSCIDARNRYIRQILPFESKETIQLKQSCPVYLVTHDRIAVSFALLNGVNVIYLDYYGRIFIFKNASDRTLKGSGKSMENLLFNGIKDKWFKENGEMEDQLYQLLATANKYNEDRDVYLNTGLGTSKGKLNDFENMCNNMVTTFNTLNLTGKNPVIKFQKDVKSNLQNLFMAAVELAFIKINLIDIKNDIEFINNNSNLFAFDFDEDDENLKIKINTYSKALNNIKGVQDKFGILPSQSSFTQAFANWINGNVTKLDVYKSAKKVLDDFNPDSPETSIFDFNRLLSFFSKDRTEERKTDSNIFLPFIQDIYLQNKNNLLSVLNALTPKLEQYIAFVNAENLREPSRGLHPNKVFYNKLANLLYESFIFIDNTKFDVSEFPAAASSSTSSNINTIQKIIETPDETDGRIYSVSTDNILLKNDKDELDILRSEGGKPSNFTGNTEESVDEAEENETIVGNVSLDEPSKIFNLKCTVTGKSINCTGSQEENEMVGANEMVGGGYIDSYWNTDPMVKVKTESVICDVSLKQVNWPLLTANLTDKTSINSLTQFSEQVKAYVTNLNQQNSDEMINQINLKIAELLTSGEEVEKYRQSLMTPEVSSLVKDINSISSGLMQITSSLKKGGAPPIVSKDLMKDFGLGFHPLTPIYAMLTSYYNIIGEKSQSDPFFYTYFTYVNILEKMKKVLEDNYLDNTINSPKTASAYIIGFGLYIMIFASHTSLIQNNQLFKMLNMEQKDYFEFSLKNDGFSALFSGSIKQTPDEEVVGLALVNNSLFNNFINNEVNIKQILEQGTPVENLPDYTVLKDRMFQLMGEIVVKVNADRGTPIGAASGLASGIANKTPVNLFLMNEPKKEMVYTTSSTSTRSTGGRKRSKRYLNNKRKTIKKRANKKTSKNITKKRYRRPRRTRRV